MLTVAKEKFLGINRFQFICLLTCVLLAFALRSVSACGQATVELAQSPAQTPATPATENVKQQKIPTVTTTVVVQGATANGYLPETLSVGNLDGASLQETPISALVVTRALMDDQQARLLSDVVKNDASIGEDYAPVGYYGDYEIRGVPIDLATGIEINSMTIAGEQDVPFENKERVEFLKGIAGIESGVASAGGLVNFETKRAVGIHAFDFATDHRGSAYGATDLGWLFGGHKQFGLRTNLAGERIASYVSGANGWRAVGAAAFDWKISSHATWTNDFEYQHKVERSVSGYQLLGGVTVPDLNLISPATMLGFQNWAKPNTFDVYNTGSRIEYELPHGWRAQLAGSFSHSLIDDNVVYAYGCGYEAVCNGTTPPWFFAPDGSFDIYDYRNPGELRIDAQAEALIVGHIRTGKITQDLSGGGELFARSVQEPGYYTTTDPFTTTITDGAVYQYVGTENIYAPDQSVPIESPQLTAGPRRLWENHHDASAIVQDRIHLPWHLQFIVGGRVDSFRDHNYSTSSTPGISGPATNPCLNPNYDPTTQVCIPTPPSFHDQTIWLPTYAATYTPRKDLTLYGNYSVLLSLGPQGPWWANGNPNQFLSPFYSRQAEVGAKFVPGEKILVTAALFHLRTPFFYVREINTTDKTCGTLNAPNGTQNLCFESDGHETHDGVELNAEGKVTSWLRLSGSATAMNAISDNSQTPTFNGKQIINQPHLRTAFFADVAMPHVKQMHLMPGWGYTGRKEATRDDVVSVPGYNIFNFGARFEPGGESGHMSVRLYADNISDKRYWKDTGASYGDTFLHLGAPTTVRLSLHYKF